MTMVFRLLLVSWNRTFPDTHLLQVAQPVTNYCMAAYFLMTLLSLVSFCCDAAARCTHAHAHAHTHIHVHIYTRECPCTPADMHPYTPAHTRMHAHTHACRPSCVHTRAHTALRCATRVLPGRSLRTVMPSVSMRRHTLQASQHSSYSVYAYVQLLRFLLLAGFAFCPVMGDPPSVRIRMS